MYTSYEMFKDIKLENLYFIIGLIPAVFYLVLSKLSVDRSSGDSNKVLIYFFVTMATFAITMIPVLHFSDDFVIWITMAWFIETIVLAMITWKTKIKMFLTLALPVLGVAVFRLFFFESTLKGKGLFSGVGEQVSGFTPILNERFLVFALGIVAVLVVAMVSLKDNRKNIARFMGVLSNIIALSWIYIEINSMQSAGYMSEQAASLYLSLAYLIYAGVLMYFGIAKRLSGFRIFALFVIAVVILKAYFHDIWDMDEIWRVLAFIILGFFILIVGYVYTKNKDKIKDFLVDEK